MKIIHISHSDGRSGAGIAAKRIHEALESNKKNYKSLLLVNRNFNSDLKKIKKRNLIEKLFVICKLYLERFLINLLNYKDQNFHSLSIFPSNINSEINKIDHDIVNLHWVQHEMISIEEIGKIKKPIVWTLHDAWPFSSTNHYPLSFSKELLSLNNFKNQNNISLNERIDKWCLERKLKSWKQSMKIVCPSNWIAKCARDSEIMKNWDINVIPNPLNTDIFFPINKKKARKFLQIPNNKKLIVFGALDGTKDLRKGADLLFKTLNILQGINNDFKLITFGKSDTRVRKNNLSIECFDMGFISKDKDLAIIYSAADILIMPSRMESFGQVASESMACGTAVIGFNTSGIKDIIDDNENGFLVRRFDCSEMAAKINIYLRNDSMRKSFESKAREKALKMWSYNAVASKYINLYEKN